MIIKGYGVYKLICDDCFNQVEKDSFEDCIEHMKKVGWTTEREDGEWYNYCQACEDWEGD